MSYKLLILMLITSAIFIQGCKKECLDCSNSLIKIEVEPSGMNCISGGIKISSGLDINHNNTLDSIEITSTSYICNGLDGYFDKQVIIPFIGVNNLSTSSASGVISTERELKDFNISDYPGADSIVFGGFPETSNGHVWCIVELYDNTNLEPIKNSRIESIAMSPVWQTTDINFIDELPSDPIDLAISIKSSQEGTEVSLKEPTLIIYRR
jgi:hypothetical protein